MICRGIFQFSSGPGIAYGGHLDGAALAAEFGGLSADHIEHLEKGLATPSTSSNTIDLKLAAKLRHRVDWRLIPALGAMYGISLMDRKNVSNAAIAGMLSDLRMSRGYGYNLVNLCFFITYVLWIHEQLAESNSIEVGAGVA